MEVFIIILDGPKVVPGLINSITKGLDFTYRLNMGLLTSTSKVVREATKKKTWVKITILFSQL